MRNVIWEEPSPQHRWHRSVEASDIPDWVPTLQANPRRWARVEAYASPKDASTAAQRLRTGQGWVRLVDGPWEAAVRKKGSRTWVYARYLGEKRGAA